MVAGEGDSEENAGEQLFNGGTVKPNPLVSGQRFGSFMLNDPAWSRIFAPGGRLLAEGDFISRSAFAWTLSLIAEQGAEAFYKVLRSYCLRITLS